MAGGHAGQGETPERVGGDQTLASADHGTLDRIAVGELHDAADRGARGKDDIGRDRFIGTGRQWTATPIAPLAIGRERENNECSSRHLIDRPEARLIGCGPAEDQSVPRQAALQRLRHVNRRAGCRRAVRHTDTSAPSCVFRARRPEHDCHLGAGRFSVEQTIDRPGQAVGVGRLHGEAAERNAGEAETSGRVGEDAPPQFARVEIGEKIDRRPGRRGDAIGQQHLSAHRASTAEAQCVVRLAAEAPRQDGVVDQRAIQALRFGDGLGHGAGDELCQQRVPVCRQIGQLSHFFRIDLPLDRAVEDELRGFLR